MITVPEVRMSPICASPPIYVMPLGGRDAEDVLDALERNKRYMRGEIARRVNLKFAPEIRFRIDERFDEAERIEKLLRTPESAATLRAKRTKMAAHAFAPKSPTLATGEATQPMGQAATRNATSATCTAGWCSTSRSA